MLTFLSLDLSSYKIGWCLWDGTKYIDSGVIDVTNHSSPIKMNHRFRHLDANRRERVRVIHEMVDDLIIENNVDYVVKETAMGYRNNSTAVTMGVVHGAVETINIPFLDITPNEWMDKIKRLPDANGVSKKSKSAKRKEFGYWADNFFISELNRIPKTDDESDAYCLGYYHIYHDDSGFGYHDVVEMFESGIKF